MSEKCKTCDGTGSVPAEVETAVGPMPCPYIGAPCPDCPPERVIVVRESEWREMREALKALLGLVQDQPNETDLAFGITEIAPYLKVDGSTRGVITRARRALTAGGDDG